MDRRNWSSFISSVANFSSRFKLLEIKLLVFLAQPQSINFGDIEHCFHFVFKHCIPSLLELVMLIDEFRDLCYHSLTTECWKIKFGPQQKYFITHLTYS